ncbi:flagellar hook capping FlgD N-terminal domain-containing protein [Jannaschia donghaensis]|uniref:Basal-body rod modification protein FlgD n=1 Tax=Jannaschia donghaensis TaxID=420998 RepID=A0A0M6YKF5_9RHOB|nr:flagellar hook capping FlgD N-terminal domain-containing protein [Jannaschia donghaensis]CTQ49526.1 Basal-body rod modification protein FlgD [Jannaschia donghaensis]
MDVIAPTLTPNTPSTSTATAQGDVSPTSDFDTFLTLLTAQIRNQDPLEPADSTEYTSQLATFSNVEQAVKTNDLLTSMIARLDTQQISNASNWIGMEVRHSGPIAHDGTSQQVYPNINPRADRAELVVYDLAGTEVGRHAVDPDGEVASWPPSGQVADYADGGYLLEVQSWAGDQVLTPTAVEHYAGVTEVVLGTGGAELILDGIVRLPTDALQSIRRPAA